MAKTVFVSPSILSANFSKLGEDIQLIEKSGADWVHVDVMDGNFVPNLSFGAKILQDVRQLSSLFFDVHLMVNHPEHYFHDFKKAGANSITFHYEAAIHHHRLIGQLEELELRKGISIVPSTPVEHLDSLLHTLDLVLIMTVNPGFGGQKLIPFCLEKVRKLVQIRRERNLSFQIQVDGGINEETFLEALDAGADNLVTGSAFFSSSDPKSLVDKIKKGVK